MGGSVAAADALQFSANILDESTSIFRYCGVSEAFELIHAQARQIILRDAEIALLRKRLGSTGRRLARFIAAKKGVATRQRRRRTEKP